MLNSHCKPVPEGRTTIDSVQLIESEFISPRSLKVNRLPRKITRQ
jgi:hypothetical protein